MIALYLALLERPEENAAFEDIYNAYKGKMMAVAYNILGNYHDSEEAVSQAFFAAARNFRKISEKSVAEREAYLNIITKNAALDIYRQRNTRDALPIEDAEEIPDESANVSDEVLSIIGYNRVLEAIRALPELYSEALYLFNAMGMSVREIASSLGVGESVIKKRLQRGREKLRDILTEEGIRV